jgi:hypothetical protein
VLLLSPAGCVRAFRFRPSDGRMTNRLLDTPSHRSDRPDPSLSRMAVKRTSRRRLEVSRGLSLSEVVDTASPAGERGADWAQLANNEPPVVDALQAETTEATKTPA